MEPATNEAFEGSSKSSSSSSSTTTSHQDQAEEQAETIEFTSLDEQPKDGHFELNMASLQHPQLSASAKREAADGGEIVAGSGEHLDNHFVIKWEKLDYVVESKWYKFSSQRKPILNALSGSFRSGELSAVLGPSGAGKSSLIDCLMGKRERGLRGRTRVEFNNSQVEEERRKGKPLKIATIPQQDHLLDSLTVTETFMFASKIKNAHLSYNDEEEDYIRTRGRGGNEEEKKKKKENGRREAFDHFANVQRVIQQLNLSSCANMKCAKLSGGQYKRVSIGQELLSRPDLLILDEPTSGLDSVTCFQTIKALRQLIESSPYPMAIVATIHQPDVEVFNLFHKAYVLADGGRAIFEGPTGAILDTVASGLELVERRRKQRRSQSLVGPSIVTAKEDEDSYLVKDLEKLRDQLEAGTNINPARLIVEVAANEYGFEITSALNQIQTHQCGGTMMQLEASHSSPLKRQLASADHGSRTSTISLVNSSLASTSSSTAAPADAAKAELVQPTSQTRFDYEANNPRTMRADLDPLLRLVLANVNRKRSLWVHLKHLVYHTQRSWLTIRRDPMLFSVQVFLHIFVPLLISYSFQGHRGDACPRIGPLDLIEEAYRGEGNVLEDLDTDLRIAFENMGYMFFQIYVIIFAAVCMTSLTYPLAMHVLLKEYRNGWYSMPAYFLGRTLADLPVPSFNVIMAMAISYHLTGQPLSPYGWRFISVAMLTVLATLVAQTQGLMFGAMLMNAPQSAVFVAPASTAPLVVVSGFLIRIQSLPIPLQILSNFSYFTHLLNGFIISRYGFNRCACDEEDFKPSQLSHQIPQQARALIDIWVESFAGEYNAPEGSNNGSATTQIVGQPDLIGKLLDTISKAKTFGFEMSNCEQVKPYTMLDYQLEDHDLAICFGALIMLLIMSRWLTYAVLSYKISSSI